MWLMNGTQIVVGGQVGTTDPDWQIVGSGDYNGDGRADILWRHSSGTTYMWLMNGTQIVVGGQVGTDRSRLADRRGTATTTATATPTFCGGIVPGPRRCG